MLQFVTEHAHKLTSSVGVNYRGLTAPTRPKKASSVSNYPEYLTVPGVGLCFWHVRSANVSLTEHSRRESQKSRVVGSRTY